MKRNVTDTIRLSALGVAVLMMVFTVVGVVRCDSTSPVRRSSRPIGIMGTQCELAAVANEEQASQSLVVAEDALRDVETLMSVHIDATELSRFNAGDKGDYQLSSELIKVFRAAGEFHEQTHGAFDVTCYPLIQLWKECKAVGRLPSEGEIAEVRRRVGMKHLQIGSDGVTKLTDGVSVDLGGIAKGYAIDRAIEAMIEAGAEGGLVNVGGDLRCFGTDKDGKPWPVKIRHPFDKAGICATLSVTDAAVATSGDYHRYFEVSGRRFSHIVDPRMGHALPQGHAPSVTVISLPFGSEPQGRRPVGDAQPSAAAADAWATALSVLGPKGIELINKHPSLEAMIITGTPDKHEIHMSEGFKSLLSGAGIKLD